jgi:hypothetical protein
MMQLLFVPDWKRGNISMDFMGGFPKTLMGSDSIWVIVDRLTKSAHFIPIKTGMFTAKLVEIYVEWIIRLHGIPSSIVSNRYEVHIKILGEFARSFGNEVEVVFCL